MRYGHTEVGCTLPWYPMMHCEFEWTAGDLRAHRESWVLAGAQLAQRWTEWVSDGRRRSAPAPVYLHRKWPWTLAGSGKGSALWLARMLATPYLYRVSDDRDDRLQPMTDRTVALCFNSCLMEAWTGKGRKRMSERRRAWRALRDQAGLGAALGAACADHLEGVVQRYVEWQAAGGEHEPEVLRKRAELLEWLATAGDRCIEANRKIARRRQAGLPVHLPGEGRRKEAD